MFGYVDDQGRLLGLNEADMSGNSGWMPVATVLTVSDPLTDDHGAALYKVVNGTVQERSQQEREADWPEPTPPQPTVDDKIEALASKIDYVAMMTDVDIPEEEV